MNDADRFKLLHGPFRSPRCRIGGKLFCEVRGWVPVRAMSDGRIVWPMTIRTKGGGKPFLIVCGDLVKAIRRESAIAICHWWGVTAQTVTVWRKALGVEQYNEGTRRLSRDWTPERLPPEVQERARTKANSPDANAKKAAWHKGRPVSDKVLAALAKGRKRVNSPAARQKHSETNKQRGIRPPVGRLWTAEEDALLGTLKDSEVAKLTGRTVCSVRSRRCDLGRQRRGWSRRKGAR